MMVGADFTGCPSGGYGQAGGPLWVETTATAPAREVEAVVQSPTNMAAAKIAAVDFNKMTSLDRPACLRPCSLGEDLLANRRLQTLPLLL